MFHDLFSQLGLGFETIFSLANLGYCFIGVLLGTAIGVLPGLGPAATVAMLLPLTFSMPVETSLIMLAGIYYGAQYGGSTTAILVNLPGETSSVVTAIDGYQLARQGQAGVALATAALSSFFAGTVSTVIIALFAPPLARVAVSFGPAEYFSLLCLGLVASIVLASGSLIKAVGMIFLGLLLGTIGTDVNTGVQRFIFGQFELSEGINFIALATGIFGIAEIIANLSDERPREVTATKIRGLMPSRQELKRIFMPTVRGTLLGSLLGTLPGGGAALASFGAYALEKRVSPNRAMIGKGALEGVAAPESANNAAAQTSFIPMLTLGIPSNPVMAMMIGAMIVQGVQPGPSVMLEQAGLFWGVVASMWIGNLMLLVLNLPLVGLWVKMISIPYHFLFPMIIVFCSIGVLSVNNATFDVMMMAAFGLAGYLFKRLECELPPLLLGFILGPMLEEYLRRTLVVSKGDLTVFVTRPVSATLLLISAGLLVMVLLPSVRKTRETAFAED